MNHSNIKKIYIIFISFWIVNFFFSNYQIIPNTDDVFYTLPALNFSYTNEIAFNQLDYNYTFFERFHIYALLQGIFYKITHHFLSFNFYVYRTLNILIFITILFLSFAIFNNFLKKNKEKKTFKIVFFPIFLAMSPISQTYLLTRPEFLGILFILLSIYLILKSKSTYSINIASFFLGLSVICHPAFIIFNFFIFLNIILLKNTFKKIIINFFFNIIPIICLVLYYYVNLPESLSQFNLQAASLPYFKAWLGLLEYSFDIFNNEKKIIGLINTFYYLPVLIILFLTINILKDNFFEIIKNKNNRLIILLFLSSFLLLIVERNHTYLLGISSFFLILIIFLIQWKNAYLVKIINSFKNSKNIFFLFIFAFFMISSWNLIHFFKFSYFKNEFLENSLIINQKKQMFQNNSLIIVTTPEMVPFFYEEINKQYTGVYKNKVLWFFPDSGRAKTPLERENSIKEIKYVLDNFTDNKILWVAAKKNIYNKCLILNDALQHSEPIKLKFEKINVVYKSNKHLIFNAKNIEYSNTVC